MGTLDFYYFPTPNCWKVSILLYELGLDFNLIPVDITKGDQFDPTFAQVSPNNKIPALVDKSPAQAFGQELKIFESAAILQYLAETHHQFIPASCKERIKCFQWLFWQVGGLGPMAGQAHHFRLYANETIDYAIERYSRECRRLYSVLNEAVAETGFLCQTYSIADIACLPWIFRHERQGIDYREFKYLAQWYDQIMLRPAVVKGLSLAGEIRDETAFFSEDGQETLFR